MIESRTTRRFWKLFYDLPAEVREEARQAYQLFQADPSYPSIQFKKIHGEDNVYSARISLDYRALGVMRANRIVWYWIGSHSDYDNLI